MDKTHLFNNLASLEPSQLLELLAAAYEQMTGEQRKVVFGRYDPIAPSAPVDGAILLKEIEMFQQQSLAGYYYEPFAINSKNWRHIPEGSKKWFERMGDLLKASSKLSAQGEHLHAVACFRILYELMESMEEGEEIVFGDEIGSWMIPVDEKQSVAAYITSLAAVEKPEGFTAEVLPLIRRDSRQSFYIQAYATALRVANEAQRAHLEAEIRRQNIRTER